METNLGPTYKSDFDGGVWGLIGIRLLQFLLILVTLGIATPWAICKYERWVAKHTIVDGRRLVFDGKGGQLFGRLLLWGLLTIVTLGIFSLWLPIKYQKWLVSHIHVAQQQ